MNTRERARAAYQMFAAEVGVATSWADLPLEVKDAWAAAIGAALLWQPPLERAFVAGGRVARFDDGDN